MKIKREFPALFYRTPRVYKDPPIPLPYILGWIIMGIAMLGLMSLVVCVQNDHCRSLIIK